MPPPDIPTGMPPVSPPSGQETGWIIIYEGEGTWDWQVNAPGNNSWVSARLRWLIGFGRGTLSPARAQANELVASVDSLNITVNGWVGSRVQARNFQIQCEADSISPVGGNTLEVRFGLKPPDVSGRADPGMFSLFVQGPDVGLHANNPDCKYSYTEPPDAEFWESKIIPAMKGVVLGQLNLFSHGYDKAHPAVSLPEDRIFSAVIDISSEELALPKISKYIERFIPAPSAMADMYFSASWKGTVTLTRPDTGPAD